MIVQRPKAANQAREEGDWSVILGEIGACRSLVECDDWWTAYCLRAGRGLPAEWMTNAAEALDAQRDEIRAAQMHRAMDRIVGEIARAR